ncbi:aldehyde dehydrogenase domain-containing protein [Mycena amicta]|nr:aldehyde dehydrogenase domain-containing protein [Mycena amicta]
MPPIFSYSFKTPSYTGETSFSTGVHINGEFCEGTTGTTIPVVNPATGQVVGNVSEATPADVDAAVQAAQTAYDTVWGLNAPPEKREGLLRTLAALIERDADELAAIESLNNGKTFWMSRNADVPASISMLKYCAGWAGKLAGQTIETDAKKLAYTRVEPWGVVAAIIPWNFPLLNFVVKIAPMLAAGNAVVIKPSEITPLTALRVCSLIKEAGFPDGVVNVVVGYGHTTGQAMAAHMGIRKLSFTGSTLTGRKVMAAAAESNLKAVTLELGGKSPNIIFNDAPDLEQAVKWSAMGIFTNQGQMCYAGSRIYVQAGVYDAFLEMFTAAARAITLGDPFEPEVQQGPQISALQFERVMGYINSGKAEGAKAHLGGEAMGGEGYHIQPTIFTETKPEMKIVREEIFGPVAVVIKFEDEDDVIRQANDSLYGLTAAVFSSDIERAITTAHKLQAGTVWVNFFGHFSNGMPFGGYKQSGSGREFGEYAMREYTQVKAVHVNLGHRM